MGTVTVMTLDDDPPSGTVRVNTPGCPLEPPPVEPPCPYDGCVEGPASVAVTVTVIGCPLAPEMG